MNHPYSHIHANLNKSHIYHQAPALYTTQCCSVRTGARVIYQPNLEKKEYDVIIYDEMGWIVHAFPNLSIQDIPWRLFDAPIPYRWSYNYC